MEYLSKKVIGIAPTEFQHNVLPVWQKAKEYIDFRNFSFKGGKISRRARDQNNDGQPDYPTPVGNVFIPSGQNDWGDDALNPFQYRIMKEVYGNNAVSDPETEFSTTDLFRHSMEYLYYIHSGYVWKYAPANTQLTEMLIDHGAAHPFPNWEKTPSYIWWRNAQWAWSYAYSVLLFDPNFTFPSTASPTSPTPASLPGDLNHDGKVDISDYNLMLQNFGNTTCGNVADIDVNCKVDIFDYNILVGDFGK